MKDDGEYAREKSEWGHRLASLVVFGCWVVAAAMWRDWNFGIRAGIFLMVPMGCIWFPQVLSSLDMNRTGDKGYIGPCHPTVLRWVGWLFLVAAPGVFTLFVRKV